MKKEKIYLVDFDGTITKQDTLVHIAAKLCPDDIDEWGRKIMSGEFSVKDWIRAFENIVNVSKGDYNELLKEVVIDEHFSTFAKENEVVVISGGFLYNIEEIFKLHDINNIKVYANTLSFIDNNKVKIDMDYYNEECSKCGVCKADIIKRFQEGYKELIYIGDGITDICAVEIADRVYVKKGSYLEEICSKREIEHTVFENFKEVR